MWMLYILIIMLLFVMLSTCLMSGWSWVIELSIVNLKTLVLELSFFMDKEASSFVITVCLIFAMVYWYSFSYLSSEVFLKRFLMILMSFVISMCILILSGNLFNSLIGWDGLGVTSMFLILYYYSSSSLKAGTLTFLMNRVGDCFFILTLTSIFMTGENQLFFSSMAYTSTVSYLLLATSITKSAQIPFSTWLPAAMEAPTPVSSLVHSSTLVTAGIFLLYRYNLMWSNAHSKLVLGVLSISTCLMASLAALVEMDLKKLIALSTLSQLGFIMFSFSLSMLYQGYFHMIMHAYFKALLFMSAGLMIHSFKSNQSITVIRLSKTQSPLLTSITSCSILSLMGLPFMSGFYSKDMIVDSLSSIEYPLIMIIILMVSLVCTALYSVRMVWFLMKSSNNWHCMENSDLTMVKPMVPLATLSCLGGSLNHWLLMDVGVFVDSSKIGLLAMLLLSVGTYWISPEFNYSSFLESKWNLEPFNPLFSSSFFLVTWQYQGSSDLSGIPATLIESLKYSMTSTTNYVLYSTMQYSGNLEVFMFYFGLALSSCF